MGVLAGMIGMLLLGARIGASNHFETGGLSSRPDRHPDIQYHSAACRIR
jgi:hypothetical protein